MQEEYHLLFPKVDAVLDNTLINFVIENMKCQSSAVVYYKLHCFDLQGNEILVNNRPLIVGERWIVDEEYSSYIDTSYLEESDLHNINKLQVELIMINVNDNNPLLFNHIMLSNKEYDGSFHSHDELIEEANIGFNKNRYVNLYTNKTENYLQIIRPNGDHFTTKKLLASEYTILVPHLENEEEIDNPSNILMEYINQTEQTTNIHNSGFKM